MSKQRRKHHEAVRQGKIDRINRHISQQRLRAVRNMMMGLLPYLPKYHGTQHRGIKRWK